ncbi:hypothetical protein AMS68_003069 [Peltaster fructicola]|uniref:DUF676 domain-containing protein n=1 Tax=Peltaster fructicola TaxID=286661 RepID=A0A6H0XS11_9PEZI|nr:hypothetical protein AMS68_003069 [Peltaster fructicola]
MSVRPIATVLRQAQLTRRASNAACFHVATQRFSDPRLKDEVTARIIHDDFAALREAYEAPKHPLVLAHGLLGFDELHVIPAFGSWKLPGLQYWSGITEALTAKGIDVIIATVPPSGSIEERAGKLAEKIRSAAGNRGVNVIAYVRLLRSRCLPTNSFLDTVWGSSKEKTLLKVLIMHSGLDARFMISKMQPDDIRILSLTTVATPHRGSAFADYMFKQLGPTITETLYAVLGRVGFSDTKGFAQLTREYMNNEFNPLVQDDPNVRYFSYGAQLNPHLTSVFRYSHNVIQKVEGENDGLVSVESSRWGDYKGTLENVSHLDLINWTNKLRWWAKEVMFGADGKAKFNAIAFYLAIADMLAKEGL